MPWPTSRRSLSLTAPPNSADAGPGICCNGNPIFSILPYPALAGIPLGLVIASSRRILVSSLPRSASCPGRFMSESRAGRSAFQPARAVPAVAVGIEGPFEPIGDIEARPVAGLRHGDGCRARTCPRTAEEEERRARPVAGAVQRGLRPAPRNRGWRRRERAATGRAAPGASAGARSGMPTKFHSASVRTSMSWAAVLGKPFPALTRVPRPRHSRLRT